MNKRYILTTIIGIAVSVAGGSLSAQSRTDAAKKDTSVKTTDMPADKVPGRLFELPVDRSTSSVSSVSGTTLYTTPAPNLTNTLYGRLSGLTVGQGSGEPSPSYYGGDNANLGVRGVGTYGFGSNGFNTLKYFVDGFEVNIDYVSMLSPTEIESVSVLKDAAALATLGMRGANGALWIVTRRGKAGKNTIQFNVRTGLQSAININKPLDSYGYATLYNQAISNDNGNIWTPKYSATQLQAYQNGTDTNVDWYKQVIKNHSPYTDGDLVFNGGDENTKYNVVFDYANQQGLYNVANTSTTSNELMKKYNLRTNLDFKILNYFQARVDIGGRIEDRALPNYATNYSTAQLWNDLARYPSNIYPIYDGNTSNFSGTTVYPNNPVASLNGLGFQTNHTRILQGNFGLREKLDFITPGLYLDEAYSFNSFAFSTYNKTATYGRYINGATTTADKTTAITASSLGAQAQEDWRQSTATLGYEHQFGKSYITSAVNFAQSDYRGEGQFGYQYHYDNLSGRVNYSYDKRFIAEFGFSEFGVDAYAPGNQWGFYPAISGAWIVSNEAFLKNNKIVSQLKLRASIGKTGSADSYATSALSGTFSSANGRYLYQQYYQGSPGVFYTGTGTGGATATSTLVPYFIANPGIFAEQSVKSDIGADLTLFKRLTLTMDVFLDKRSGIITLDNSIPGDFGIVNTFNNVGKMTNKGFEVTGQYTGNIGKVGYAINGMASFTRNTIDYEAELPTAYGYNAQTGREYGTVIGLVSTGLYQLTDFNSDGSLKASQPIPAFGKVQPGDIKYQDLNGDGKVDQTDVTAIGKPVFPELTYSFGANVNYMGFDAQVLFQGTEGSSVNLNAANLLNQTQAFVNNGTAYSIAQGAWAYYPDQGIDTRATATYPRLTTLTNNNNYRTSSYWIKSGDYLRIRNVEIGYSLNNLAAKKIGMSKLRIFVSAMNPVTWSSLLKNYHIDPETVSGYPALKSYNVGVTGTF